MSEQYNYTGSEIAVIGMAGRFPGSGSIREYWENLKKGESGITFFSDQELEQAGVNPEELKKTNYVKSKGMLVDVEYFDASFFNFTVREAETMDPQMRLLHETCWHALEDAGYNPGTYGGSIGFYCGVGIHIYWMAMLMNRAGSSSELFELMAVNDIPMMGTQVAYRLNLKGPVVTLQTACSASLVSVHMAGQALLSGECDMALAGGVSVKLPAKSGYMYQEGMIMSRDGHCRPFDANASGTVSGEGVGIVVLKPLENAIPDRDHIYAVLKGTAINNDGSRRIGYSAPSIKGQAEVIHIAQQAAGVAPETITYVEAHGTGTSLGDPVEIRALAQAFDTDKKQFCRIGSVKSNIGHLDAAAGIAGFIKTVLAIYHGMIPPSLHFETPNPEIDFTDTPFIVNTSLYDWTTDGNPRRAGVSSFGIGGTNAHVILEEWTRSSIHEAKQEKETQLILLSSRTETGLERNTHNLAEFLKKNPGTELAGTAYTLQTGRKAFAYRRTLVTQETTEAAADLAKANNSPKVHTYHAVNQNPPIVYIFSGLGSQYIDMGYNLYQQEPLFRKEMDACFQIIASLTGNNLKGLLYPSAVPPVFPVTSTQNISHPEISQLVIFIIEYALATLLMKWGIYPHAMIGYSFGEYIAACIAGVITLEQALNLVVQRGKLIAQTIPGGMLSVPLTRRELELLLPETGEIYLAIDNGPSCIIAGPQEAIETFTGQMKKRKHLCMRLNANHALHTPLMNSIRVEFEQKLKEIPWKEPQIPYISNLTGQWQTKEQAMDPGYWVRHLSSTVRFNEGINLLAKEPYTIFIELGPGRDISAMIQRTLDKTQHVINLIRPQQKVTADSQYLLERLGRLWLLGKDIDWKGYYESKADDGKRNRVSLPGYSFERQCFAVNGTNGIKSQVTETETGINKSSTYTYKPFQLPGETEAPRDELEAKITNAYRHIFGHEQIGIHDDFFELGGDSLKVITLVTDIHRQLDVDIPMEVVFKNTTAAELANYIGKKAGNRVYASIPQAEKKEYYPLSPSQLRVFIIEQIDEKGMAYNMPGATWMKGPLDIARLEKAYLQMIERHESLRTGFFTYREEPVQRIYEPNEIKFALEYFEIENIGDTKAAIEGIIDNFIKAFDISQPPLWQVGLVRASENKYLLLDKLHHIISDDISIGILMTEVTALYRGETLTKPVIQYKDYVEWQTKEGKNLLKEQEAFWLDCFHDAPDLPVLDLPFDFPRPALQSFDGDHIVRVIPLELKEKLYILARKNKTTLFVLLFSIYNILLYRYSRQEDIIVGIPITGRSHRDVQEIVGMFVNTLALRNYPRGNKTIELFLQEVKENTLKAFANQFYQFDDLVNRLALNRDMGRNPLFDALFVLHTVNVEKIQFPGIELSIYEHEHPFCRFDLTLNAAEFSKGINLGLEYTTALFKKETMEQFMENFFVIVETAVINPQATLDEIPMAGPRPGKKAGLLITDEDREKIVKEFNATSAPYPRERTLTELFADQVMQTPDHIALEAPAARNRCALTYSKLNETSNQVARRLKTYGAGTAKIIAFLTDRSEKILVGLLAILKSGAAYLPIDPRYPGERMNYMVKDAKVTIILAAGFEIPFKHTAQVIDLTRESNFDTLEKRDLPANGKSTSPAYVIYTSGTTGKPKGVMIENRSVVNFIFGITRVIPFTHMDSILCLTSQGFDIFGLETLAPLLTGARVMMGNVEEQLSAEAAAAILDRDRITILQVTPSRLQIFISFPGSAGSLKRLNYLLVGGEAFPRHLLEKVKPLLHKQARIYNLYGPTETTIWSTLKDLSHENVITIGKPLANTYIYIVDHDGEWQPIGKTGELCIGGEGLARGYLNNPELTAEKFIMKRSDRSDKTSNKRSNKTFILYKTGDQAKWLPDGNIEFLGRSDRQVKIRGFRIELGEIENRLLSHPKVREVVVVPQESEGGKDKYLCIYIVPAVYPVETLETAELQDYLAAALPDYMVPAYFVILERIPLNPNGKVDLKALPEPDRSAGKNHVPPQNEIENVLAGIWADILGIDREQVGIHDNFFRMGGHSLKATVLTGRIQKAFSVAIPIPELFKTPTIKGIANYIARTGKSVYLPLQPAEEKEYYPLSSTQKRLYLLNQADKSSKAYNMPAVFFLEGQLKKERLTGICKQLTRRHESFRTSFAQIEGEPVQRVHREVNFEIEYYDLTAQGAMGSEAEKIHHFIRAFDLSKAPLLRVGLIETGVGEYILVFDMHHIISDGASMGLLIREFMVLYEGKTLPLPRIQYKDYTEWQRSETWQESLKEAEAFWLEHLQGVGSRPRLKLPADFDRPAVRNFAGATFEFELGPSETARLKQLAKEEETTLYMLLLALYFVLLVRLSGQEDITVGTPVVGRQREEFQSIIGMFVNTVAMRHFPKLACPFKNFLKEVKEKTLNVFKYQDYPFERLIDKVEPNPDKSHNPLFDVMLTFQNMDIPTFHIPGLALKPYPYENVTAKFDLNLICSENNETLLFALEYSTNLFKADTIGRFAGYFKDIIDAILENRDKKMGDINMSLEFSESKSDLSLEAVGDFRF